MQSYPFTSEVTYDNNGRPQYDRTVNADFLRKFYQAYWSNGVFYKPATSLQVTTDTGMQVKVLAGMCQINGAFGIESTDRTLVVQASDSLDRIDTVVARLDLNRQQRNIDLYIVKGTASESPIAPDLTRNNTVYELGLANLFIAKNSTAISQQRITDTRLDTERCGVVAQTVGDIDTSAFFTQLTTLTQDLQNEIASIEQGSAVMLKSIYASENVGAVKRADTSGYADSAHHATYDANNNKIDIKALQDSINTAQSTANNAMPKSGGNFTGAIAVPNSNLGGYFVRNIWCGDASEREVNTSYIWTKRK